MNFEEARKRFARLTAERTHGQISEVQYSAAVNELRVADSSGVWWQPDPSTGEWIFWNGTRWETGDPPLKETEYAATKRRGEQGATPASKPGKMDLKGFREMSRTTPASRRPQSWWDFLSVLGGVVAAALWFLYGSVRAGAEGFDFLTPIIMVGIPLILIRYRHKIDGLLTPVQPFRKRFPSPFRIGMGLAAPFLTAILLFNLFGISNYALMHANLLVGTFVSYAIVREPAPRNGTITRPPGGATAALLILLLSCLCVSSVMADDCLEDPLNANDCLRTSGTAEGLAGIGAATLSVLVNGPTILQGFSGVGAGAAGAAAGAGTLAGAKPPEPGEGAAGPEGEPSWTDLPGGDSQGGPDDNPYTEYDGGEGPGLC
ncbi:MAG: hypothetical protein RQ758_02595 [Methanomicrobiaceae archaeon]|nr:hypothetical protein [Methanomicrobiaceae archaeon]